MALIGLDIGTTGCKCSIFDGMGNISAYSYREYGVFSPEPGMFELNPEEVWESVKIVIGTAAANYRGDRITAICVSSFGEAGVPLDREGRVLSNSFIYTDIRGEKQCRELTEKLGLERIMEIAGVHAHPMYTINKVMWIKKNLSDIYKRIWKFMLFEDFIMYRLGQVEAIDWSLASRTMAFNVTKKIWEAEIFEASQIKPDIFSKAYSSGTVVGSVKNSIAEELGLPKGVMLVTGGHDQVCAALGGGIIKKNIAINGMGTVECITPAFDRPLLGKRMLNCNFACVPHAVDGMYVTYAFNFTGGALLKWYRDNFAKAEKLDAERSGENVYAILDQKALKSPTDILVLPHFAGAGTPRMDTCSKGAVVGLGFDKGSSHLYRALLEGITYEMLYNIECLEEAGMTVNELRAVGGGAKSELWLQIKADIMGRRIVTLDVDEAGTLGTAILAGVATGVYKSLESAVDALVRVKNEYYPDGKNHDIYMENYMRYKKLYGAVKEILA
jgi:xylulokinase